MVRFNMKTFLSASTSSVEAAGEVVQVFLDQPLSPFQNLQNKICKQFF